MQTFVEVILPLAIQGTYTYSVPNELLQDIAIGKRVEVQFGKSKYYAGLIGSIHNTRPELIVPKSVLSILDDSAIVTEVQLQFWRWIADYYCSTLGEVMAAALPSAFRLQSDTFILLNFSKNIENEILNDEEYLIIEALHHQNRIDISTIQKILQRKHVMPIVRSLLYKNFIFLEEELQYKYKPRLETFIRISTFLNEKENLQNAFQQLLRAPKQSDLLMILIHKKAQDKPISKKQLSNEIEIADSALKELQRKGYIEIIEQEISRIETNNFESLKNVFLNEKQQIAKNEIQKYFQQFDTVLLHGITGSGKTEIYIDIAKEKIAEGSQVLYLVPEIFLTTQLVQRLKTYFGNDIIVYHSKFSENERLEIWNTVLQNKAKIVIGARSAVFLPFQKLGLVIIDEEHETSYKQHDPSPRYHARDAALYLAKMLRAKVLLGSATPSIEQYYYAKQHKIGMVKLTERFAPVELPTIELIDTIAMQKQKRMKQHFSEPLLHEIKEHIAREEQVILFNNRRGFAPIIECKSCAWTAMCKNCAIALTHHKLQHNLVCHYCNYTIPMLSNCPACGNHSLQMQGAGTERIEEEIELLIENIKSARVDYDTTRTKKQSHKLIETFENRGIDVLVGTQMIAKGLDFDNVQLVGVINADQLTHFPNFRANERAFQLLTQVAGRAGRKNKQGTVLIQTKNTAQPVLQSVQQHDYVGFFEKEIEERKRFLYPPFTRIIQIEFKHKDQQICRSASKFFAEEIKKINTKIQLQGPAEALIHRINNLYIYQIVIKMNRDKETILNTKKAIIFNKDILLKHAEFKSVSVTIDVDCY